MSSFGAAMSDLAQPLHPLGCNSPARRTRSEEHTSELQSLRHLVCRLLLEKKKKKKKYKTYNKQQHKKNTRIQEKYKTKRKQKDNNKYNKVTKNNRETKADVHMHKEREAHA